MADQRAESSASRPPSGPPDAVHAEPDTKPRGGGEIPGIESDDAPAPSESDSDGQAAQADSTHADAPKSDGSKASEADSAASDVDEAAPDDDGVEEAEVEEAEPARVGTEPKPTQPESVDARPVDARPDDAEPESSEPDDSPSDGPEPEDPEPDDAEDSGASQTPVPEAEVSEGPAAKATSRAAVVYDPMSADTLTMHAVATDSARAEEDDPEVPRRRRLRLTSILAAATFGLAGFLAVTSAVNAKGTDLRAERQTDVADLARAQLRTNRELDSTLAELRAEVDDLLARQLRNDNAGASQKKVDELAPAAGLTPLVGPGVTVVLDDAPPSVRTDDTDPDALVVHQQDIQAVVNAMWAGGAEAMTIQGQRVISTSAIRCVGNSVVLHGVPYPPPYRIEAIGDVSGMVQAIGDSPAVTTYLEYVADPRYRLGWKLERSRQLKVPAFEGSVELDHAEERKVTPGGDSDD